MPKEIHFMLKLKYVLVNKPGTERDLLECIIRIGLSQIIFQVRHMYIHIHAYELCSCIPYVLNIREPNYRSLSFHFRQGKLWYIKASLRK